MTKKCPECGGTARVLVTDGPDECPSCRVPMVDGDQRTLGGGGS